MTVIQFQTSCLQFFFMPSITHNSERDRSVRLDSLHTLLCRSICPSFVDFVLLFSFHYETAINRSYSVKSFFTRKRMAVKVEYEKHEDACPLELFKVSIS